MNNIHEIVPFNKKNDILSSKVGKKSKYKGRLRNLTFGVEFEFKHGLITNDQLNYVMNKTSTFNLTRNIEVHSEIFSIYKRYFIDKKEIAQKEFIKDPNNTSLSDWEDDDKYGPLSPEYYKASHISFNQSEFNNLKRSNSNWNIIDSVYMLEREDIFAFVKYLDESELTTFKNKLLGDHDVSQLVMDFILADLQQKLGIKIKMYGADYTKNEWVLEREGIGIELTSPILKNNESSFSLLNKISEYIHSNYPEQKQNIDFGLHVHVGTPKNFSNFDRLALYELMDENAIADIAPERVNITYDKEDDWEVEPYNQNKKDAVSKIINKITKDGKQTNSFVINDKDLWQYFPERESGINITNDETIEFRYLGINQSNQLKDWVTYYMLLLKIATTRNAIRLKNFNPNIDIGLVRLPNKNVQIVIVRKGDKLKLNIPNMDMKTIKQVPFDKFKQVKGTNKKKQQLN